MDEILDSFDQATVYRQLEETVDDLLSVYPSNEASWFLQNSSHLRRAARTHGLPLSVFKRLVISLLGNLPVSSPSVVTDEGSNGSTHAHAADPRQIVALAHAFRYSCEHLQDQLGDMVELDLAFKRLFKNVEANDKLRRIVINGFRSLAENRCINDTQTRALLPNSASNNQQRSIGPIFGCSTTSEARVLTRTQSRTTTRIRNTVSDHHHSDSMGVSRDARTGASQNQERAREPGDSDDVLGSDRSIWRDNCGEAAYLRTLVNDQSYKFKTADIRWLEDTFLARPDWFKRATVGVATIFIGVGVVPYVQGLCGAANRLKTFTSMTIHIVQTLEILSASGRLLHENVVKKLFECLMAEWDGAMGEGKDHVPPMFEADIKTIRLCALQILLNSRACGLDIMETEREARHALIRGYMTHEDLKFREVATNILASYSDEAENYEQTFETCLNQLTAEQANMNTLKPMLVSASQWSRAQHLFNDERLKTINTILTAMSRPNEPYDMNFKAKCAEIIYTYVEHKEHEEGLMLDVEGTLDAIGNLLISNNMSPEYEKGLLGIIDIVFKRKRRTGLQTIVSSVQKILDVVVQRLISSIDGAKDSMDPSNRLLAVIIICRGVGLKPIGLGASTQIKPGQFGQFSKALLETLDDVQGQENKEPNLLLAFSLICLRCFQHGHGRQCTEQLLSRLLAIVNSPCSRTDEHYESKTAARLEASNAIYEAIQQNSNLASIHLLDLCTAIIQPDELPQVRCFCSLAYLSGLRQLARSSSNVGCVTQADLSILPFIMQLRFDEDQWMSVKDHVLYLLEYLINLMDPASTSTPLEPLEEALFSSINTILAEQSSKDEIRVVKFLETYTRMFALPPATADALESICQKPDLREPILEIYRNVVKLGEPIPDFALQEVVNLLFASVAEALDAFDQLQTIDQRQELPTSLFRLLEMERARIVYKTSSNVEHKTAALQFITRCVQEHRSRLSSLIFQDVVRSIVLADEPTLKLLYYAVENEHSDRAVTKLSRRILQEWNTAFGSSSQDDTMPTLLKLICLISRKGDLLSSDATTVAASIASKLSSEKNFDHCNRLLVVTYLVVIGEASQTIESATLEPVLRRMIDGTWDKECISNLVVAVLALNGELDPDLMSGLVKVLVHSALNKQTDALTGLLRLLRERKITHISMDHLNMLLRIPKTISTEDKGMINFAVSYGNLLNYAKDNETVYMDLQEETRTDLEILGLICIEEDAEFCQRIEGFVDKFSPFHWIRCMKILDSADEEMRQRLVDILHGFEPTWPNSIVRSVRKHLRAGQLENNVTSVEEKYRFASTIQSTEQLRPEDINACIQYLIKKAYSSAEFPAAEVNDFFAKLPSSAREPGSDRLIQLGPLCATIVLVDLSRRQITQTVVDVLENCITYQAIEVDVTVLDAYCLLLKDAATQERCAFHYKTEQVLVALVVLLTRSDQSYDDLRFHLMIETVLECCRLDQLEATIAGRAVLQSNLLAFLLDTLDSSAALTRALIFDHLRSYFHPGYLRPPQTEEGQLQERFKTWCQTRLETIRQSDISHQLGRKTPQPPDELDLLRAYMSVSVTHPLNLLSADNYAEDLIFLDLISIYGLNMGSRFDLLQKWGSLKTSFDDPHTVLRLLFTNICKYGLTYNRAHELLDIMTQIPKAETMNILSISGQFCLEMMKCVFWKRARDPEKLPNLSIAELKFFSLRLLKQVRNIPEMYPNTKDSVTVGILQLVLKYRLNEEEIPYDDDPVEFLYNLKILIAAKYLHPKTRHKLLGNRLGVGLRRLIEKMEDFDQILGLFEVVKARADETKSKRILGVLAHLMHQGCAANVHRVEDRLRTLRDDPSTWVEATDKFVMEHHFEDKRNVEGADYIEGLSGIPALKDLFGLQDSKALQQYLQRAVSKIAGGESAPSLTRTNASAGRFLVKNMRPSEIEEWVIEIKTLDPATLSDNVVHGILSVLNRGLSLRMNKRLKTLQIVSCLAAVKAFQTGKEGLLQQIATGCGKSAIIGTLATFHGIFGRQVDIVTSSSVLAARDAKEFNPMYKLFGLSADHNGDAGRYTRGAKSCYRCPIVYGEAAQFQFDLLRQEYSELGTLETRSLNTIVLVDEVDSMLIDDSSKIARLASSCAGMNEFQPNLSPHLERTAGRSSMQCSLGWALVPL